MGITYRTYVGPYARCTVPSNDPCPHCGRRGDEVDQWQITEKIDERLTSPFGDQYHTWAKEHRVHLWLPNVAVDGLRDGQLEERCDFSITPLTGATAIEDEMARFMARFATELSVLRDHYGDKAVTTEWGIIQDYS